jgi:hypothetical protein
MHRILVWARERFPERLWDQVRSWPTSRTAALLDHIEYSGDPIATRLNRSVLRPPPRPSRLLGLCSTPSSPRALVLKLTLSRARR